MNKMLRAMALIGMLLGCAAGAAQTQEPYPSRPIRLLVPGAPGTGTEIASRVLAEQLSMRLGQNVVVESRPGAAGNVGAAAAARAPKDGYTIFMGTIATLAMNEHLFADLGYDPDKDFEPLIFTGSIPMVIAVHPSAPYRKLIDFIDAAKDKPEAIDVALPTTTARVTFELMQQQSGAKWFPVPFNATSGAMNNVVSGQIPVIIDTVAGTRALIESGRLRALAVTSPKSTELLPGVPSAVEQGIAGLEVTAWNVLAVPRGVPVQVKAKLLEHVREILRDPRYRSRLMQAGFEPASADAARSAQEEVRAERARWGKLIKEGGIKP